MPAAQKGIKFGAGKSYPRRTSGFDQKNIRLSIIRCRKSILIFRIELPQSNFPKKKSFKPDKETQLQELKVYCYL
jgi:hypothetical protein